MKKEILGTHSIDSDTVLTDNLTTAKYRVEKTLPEGLNIEQMTSISEPEKLFISYEDLLTSFSNGNISISGYTNFEPNDNKVLYLVVSDLKNTPVERPVETIVRKPLQIKKDGIVKIKKKAKKFKLV